MAREPRGTDCMAQSKGSYTAMMFVLTRRSQTKWIVGQLSKSTYLKHVLCLSCLLDLTLTPLIHRLSKPPYQHSEDQQENVVHQSTMEQLMYSHLTVQSESTTYEEAINSSDSNK